MNIQRLKEAEVEFMLRYPGGFNNPEMLDMGKKHKIDKMKQMARAIFHEDQFNYVDQMIENLVKLVSKSSLVSIFEKPKFKEYMLSLEEHHKHQLVEGLYQLIHGDMAMGYDKMVEVLTAGKMAKWPLITLYPYYYEPSKEVFIKPTTAKNVIRYFEIEGLIYKPRPTYEFYKQYKAAIMEMASLVDSSLSEDYGAFGGFLMMTMPY